MPRNKYPTDKKNSNFAVALRELMAKNGRTQEDLAKITEKTRQTVSQYTNGISEPGYETLVKIADYFGVSLDYLLGRTSDPSRHPCAADELGLSIENVNYLKNPSIALGRPCTVPRLDKIVHSLLNDVLDICREEGLHDEFQIMQHILTRLKGSLPKEDSEGLPTADVIDKYIRRNGLFVLPAKDGAAYYADKIGVLIGHNLKEKYCEALEEAIVLSNGEDKENGNY